MMRTRLVLWTSLIASAAAIFLIGMSLSASAQGDITPQTATPLPSPTDNGDSAQWKIASMTFQSQYPKGFTFALDISSTGGKIVEAGVIWQHNPVGPRRRAQGKIDPSGKITATWTATAGDSVPQWVGVNYWWTLKDAAGNSYETPHKYDEYADNTRKWNRAESDDVIVFWQDGLPANLGQAVIDAMRANRPIYYRAWGKLLNYRPRVIVYADDKPFTEWNPGVNVAVGGVRTVGQTSQSWGGTVQLYTGRGGPQGLASGTVLHEVGHLYQYANGGASNECWFIEGDATYFEVYQEYDYLARVQEMAASGDLPTLQNGGPSCRGGNARDAYDIGYAFFKWLEETYGPGAHLNVWTQIGNGKPLRQALQTVTGLDFVAMETKFRAWLGMANPEPPTAMPTLSFTFPPTPTYESVVDATPTPQQ
jgi:hypothetical protein